MPKFRMRLSKHLPELVITASTRESAKAGYLKQIGATSTKVPFDFIDELPEEKPESKKGKGKKAEDEGEE